MSSEQELDQVIARLHHRDEVVRREAVTAISTLETAEKIAPLIYALGDSDAEVRAVACEALGQLGELAVEPLIQALYQVKSTPAQYSDFNAALSDKNLMIELFAETALVRIGMPSVDGLLAISYDTNDPIRLNALKVLAHVGDRRATESLMAALSDKDSEVRKAVVTLLGHLGDSRIIEPVIAMLDDPDDLIRYSAVGTLGMIGDTRAVESLITCLDDPDIAVRWNVFEALGQIGDPRAIMPLEQALNDDDPDTRFYAAVALADFKHPSATSVLMDALADDDKERSLDAAKALLKMRAAVAPAVRTLIQLLQNQDERISFEAEDLLREIGIPDALRKSGDNI
jgi:HEAT repeat protein